MATFDDAYFAALLDPPLTAVAYDPAEVGRRAAELLVEAIRDPTSDPAGSPSLLFSCRAARADVRRDRHAACNPARRRLEAVRRPRRASPDRPRDRGGRVLLPARPSGCGKTTTLNLIGGFVNASSGEIFIREQRVDRLPPHRRSGQHGLPVVRALPAHERPRERRLRPQDGACPAAESAAGSTRRLRLVGLEEFGDRLPGAAVRAASSSASPSPVRSSTGPRCCSSTSRSGRST